MELMIALSLATVVIAFLFGSLYQNSFLDAQLKKAEASVMTHAHVQQRLDHICSHVTGDKGIYLDEDYTLHIPFDNGIDPEKEFCGPLPATLKIRKEQLILTLYGGKKKREQSLCQAKTMKCAFLYHDGKKVYLTQEWEKGEGDNPLYIELTIDQEPYILWVNHKGKEIPLQP